MMLRIEVKDILTNSSSFYNLSEGEILMGRDPQAQISIGNKYISSRHATIIQEKDRLYIRDEKSSNGSEYYSHYKWLPVGSKKREVSLPLQIKLAEAVVVTVQSGESQIVSLTEVQNDSAIMVLDICGSTRQSVYDEQIAFHLKQRLNTIAKPILYSAPVLFYKNTGDGFLATFEKSTQAANCAIKILKTLQKRNSRSKNPPIQVRIGLHKGQTYVIDPATEDIHGIDINITFRIEGLKKSSLPKSGDLYEERDRIFASQAFYEDYMKHTRRKKDILMPCGPAKLKGIREKISIYKLNWQ
ncbi:adenylate/guanylate cyclase domain-containing protein [Spirochaeta isovalerica]|uniref:Class 3 adenylate cyclase n=1 Tax=Spirochaeta isovalerica TaxID=150 RepID=A0A841RBB5_9SPIO|nr:adenylate/guanylate cyclase domain-containing protein [Spirochaeta isovalerica]MBB6480996.1 class 3 adenylate cyclase [Spirochaeta isovalerica]